MASSPIGQLIREQSGHQLKQTISFPTNGKQSGKREFSVHVVPGSLKKPMFTSFHQLFSPLPRPTKWRCRSQACSEDRNASFYSHTGDRHEQAAVARLASIFYRERNTTYNMVQQSPGLEPHRCVQIAHIGCGILVPFGSMLPKQVCPHASCHAGRHRSACS